MAEVVHVDRPFVETNGHTLGLLGSPPNAIKANLAPHTVKWNAEMRLNVVQATVPLSWPVVVQTLLGGQWKKGLKLGDNLRQWIIDEIERRRPDPDAKLVLDSPEYTQPDGKRPRPYQMDAVALLSGVSRGFLFDDQGTGKTISAILATLRIRQRAPELAGLPVLIVAPPGMVDDWVAAWHEWTSLRATAWRGTAAQRHKLLGTADVYVAGYTTIRNDAEIRSRTNLGKTTHKFGPLLELGAGIVVLDEIQNIKNPRAVQSLAARRLALRATGMIGLSGTPISHNVADIWPALNALDPIGWPSRERMVKRYVAAEESGAYGKEVVYGFNEREPEFRATTKGQTRRVSKEDVLSHLPPKVYSVRTVDMPKEYRDAYLALEQDMVAELPGGDELSEFDVVTVIMRLTQLSCAAADVSYTWETKVDKKTGEGVEKRVTHYTMREPSWKIDELVEVARERPTRQGLVFSPSAQLTRLAAARLEREGYRVGLIIGGQKPEERTGNVTAFQAGELDHLCLTVGTGGTGLTLTSASYVVFLNRPWGYDPSAQAEDRAHRIGSEIHKMVEIIDIHARDTIDARVVDVLMGKAGATAELLEDPRIVDRCLGGIYSKTHKEISDGGPGPSGGHAGTAGLVDEPTGGHDDDRSAAVPAGQRTTVPDSGAGSPGGSQPETGAGGDAGDGRGSGAAGQGDQGAGAEVGAGAAGADPAASEDGPPW